MLGATFLTQLWLCRSILSYPLTICIVLYCSNNKDLHRLRPPSASGRPPAEILVYWNVPTFQCDAHQLNFSGLVEKFGIVQNQNGRFWGRMVNILYDPGRFPALLRNGSRNGGVPQEGDLAEHLKAFQESLDDVVPDESFAGIGIIDFESWRPVFRQNFGSLTNYRRASVALEREKHPGWSEKELEHEAARRFEGGARKFMENTLVAAKRARPRAFWGYYAYPYCFNMSPNSMREACPKEVTAENDRTKWLFKLVDNFHPSLYLQKLRMNASQKVQMIEGRINEAHRISEKFNIRPRIVPYYWFKYQDKHQQFVTKQDLFESFIALASFKIDGLVIWGSSNDVNTRKKCHELYHYIDNVLGPLIKHIF
ncbi:unnamed protein product [Phyllotreta striolata]|uniref:Hyaluronidase n=1 Tax=Phyllotreta striolata TaxID=444603 RepID=A0A9N9TQ31_PHYSR|nr:unnamed protein product [Phyllotreta striolata]